MTLDDIFGPTGTVTPWQELARAVVVFVYGWMLLRVAGRRLFGRWSALDAVVAIVTGSTLSRALTGNANLFGSIAAVTLLVALHWLLARLCARSPAASRLLEGRPVPLVVEGRVRDDELARYGVSREVLDEALHGHGLECPDDARLVLLEPGGSISVLPAR